MKTDSFRPFRPTINLNLGVFRTLLPKNTNLLRRSRRHANLMAATARSRSLFRSPVTPDTAIVKCSLSHNLIKVAILRVSRITIFAMMAYIALVEFRNSSRTDRVMASGACGALLCRMRDSRVRANERFVALVVEEDDPASSLLIEPDNLWRKSAVCLLLIRTVKHCCAHSDRYRQPKSIDDKNSQLQFHLIVSVILEAPSKSLLIACDAAGKTLLQAVKT
jgi:hypothetical protein